MTARAWLDRRMRWMGVGMYGGMAVFVAGIFIGAILGQAPILAVSLPGFAVAFVTMFVAYSGGLRCPRCRGNLGALVLQRGGFRVDNQVRLCPYCGYALDEELSEPPTAR